MLRVIGEDVELKTLLTEEELTILADTNQIDQVLINLATNARDAMPKGGSFTISTELSEIAPEYIKAHGYGKPGRYALITATDTGIGMNEDIKGKLFEPFFTTKEVGKGTGLGLAIVYGIVKHHNGYINAYSELNKGATFKIYFPIVKALFISGYAMDVLQQRGIQEEGFHRILKPILPNQLLRKVREVLDHREG